MPTRLAFLYFAFVSLAHGQTVLVKPYVQPGDGASLSGADVKVLEWLTDQKPGEFTVEYGIQDQPLRTAGVERSQLDFDGPRPKPAKPGEPVKTTETQKPNPAKDPALTIDELKAKTVASFGPIVEREQHYFRYRAQLSELPFDSVAFYKVKLGDEVIREGTFKTRASAEKPVRFIAVGDMAGDTPEQRAIAFQISLQKPDFLVALGDIVYPGGRVLQYMHHFFPIYNDVATPGPKVGAPLMASVPIYPVIGNHDAEMQKLSEWPDAFAAFYFFSVPKNGPGIGPWNLPLGNNAKNAAQFRKIAGEEYPAVSDYSFDYGPAHICCVDANKYTMDGLQELSRWFEKDLAESKQPWKFVCFHQPAFHTSREHYSEQGMRLLEPMFERLGVNVVFAGHVHNYQRSKPFTFTPNPPKRNPRGLVDGDFTLDENFDGIINTKPKGVIHIISGGGGAQLYKGDLAKLAEAIKKEHAQNYYDITAKYLSDKHSFSVIELTPTTFELRQISIDGKEVDRFRITK